MTSPQKKIYRVSESVWNREVWMDERNLIIVFVTGFYVNVTNAMKVFGHFRTAYVHMNSTPQLIIIKFAFNLHADWNLSIIFRV